MKKPPFTNNEIYHVYNRGVEKRDIALDDQDRYRFIHDLFEFNDQNSTINVLHRFKQETKQVVTMEVQPQYIKRRPRKILVEILAFCLMPNHYHLLLKQTLDKGVIKFMQKLGTGYTMYFNQKYERVGGLFQGRYKAAHVKEEAHFIHLPYYIHLNPLDLVAPEWRRKEISNLKRAMQFLENYRWSSYLDYIGIENFPSVTQREFLMKFLENQKEYRKNTRQWLKEMNLDELKDLSLESLLYGG